MSIYRDRDTDEWIVYASQAGIDFFNKVFNKLTREEMGRTKELIIRGKTAASYITKLINKELEKADKQDWIDKPELLKEDINSISITVNHE